MADNDPKDLTVQFRETVPQTAQRRAIYGAPGMRSFEHVFPDSLNRKKHALYSIAVEADRSDDALTHFRRLADVESVQLAPPRRLLK